MRWPFMLRKTHEKEFNDLSIELACAKGDARLAYQRGWGEAALEYREWMVDLNYEIFHADASTVKQKVYAALTNGAHQFKPKYKY